MIVFEGYFLFSHLVENSTKVLFLLSSGIKENNAKSLRNSFFFVSYVFPTLWIYFLKISFVSPIKFVVIVEIIVAVLVQSVSSAISPKD